MTHKRWMHSYLWAFTEQKVSLFRRRCILILLVFFNIDCGSAQFIQPSLCDRRCHCPPGEGVVDCNRQDQLQGVPTNLPIGVTKLSIQRGIFPQPSILGPNNMTGLEQLEDLRIIYCNIHTIKQKTFTKMTKLRRLDLSHNLLHRLDALTFYGLQLTNLYLQVQRDGAQPALVLSEDVFTGLSATQIDLRGNSLTSVRYKMFSKVSNLERLILSDNKIRYLDDGFEKHFDRSNRLLDLTGNPLECNCKLVWIALRSADWVTEVSGLNITCYYYQNQLAGSPALEAAFELRRLTADQLCPTTRINHIEINLLGDSSRAVLDCTATSVPRRPKRPYSGSGELLIPGLLSRTPPVVAWRYVEGGHLREVKRIPTENKQNAIINAQGRSNSNFEKSTVRLNVSIGQDLRNYTCVALDDFKEAESVIITLHGPPKKVSLKNSDYDMTPVEVNPSKTNAKKDLSTSSNEMHSAGVAFDQTDILFQKRFTVLHMSVAVVATFIITIILLIGLRVLHIFCFKRYSRFRHSSSIMSINNLDGKGVYIPGKIVRGNSTVLGRTSQQKMNGVFQTPNGTSPVFPQSAYTQQDTPHSLALQQKQIAQNLQHQQIPYHFLSSMENQVTMSPQLLQFPNMSSQFIPISAISETQQSSSSGTDELQSGLARLTSTPLIPPPGTLSPIMANETAFSVYPTNMPLRAQRVTYFPVAPGSPYSVSGSHVYDIPRVADAQSMLQSTALDINNGGGKNNSVEQQNQFDPRFDERNTCRDQE